MLALRGAQHAAPRGDEQIQHEGLHALAGLRAVLPEVGGGEPLHGAGHRPAERAPAQSAHGHLPAAHHQRRRRLELRAGPRSEVRGGARERHAQRLRRLAHPRDERPDGGPAPQGRHPDPQGRQERGHHGAAARHQDGRPQGRVQDPRPLSRPAARRASSGATRRRTARYPSSRPTRRSPSTKSSSATT